MTTARPILGLPADVTLLFSTRIVRMFAYGMLSVVLAVYLAECGFSLARVGALFSAALAGDLVITWWLTTRADRLGRRRVLLAGALLMAGAGAVFATTGNIVLLALAATIGVITPSAKEVGPFLAVEQAALAQFVPSARITRTFAWYQLAGAGAGAAGAGCCGLLVGLTGAWGWDPLAGQRLVVLAYAAFGLVLFGLFLALSPAAEAPSGGRAVPRTWLGLHASHRTVLKLSGLFSIDAFAGGLAVDSLLAYWFHARFGTSVATLGAIFMAANLLAALSALAAAPLGERFGLVNTMVFTHLPSNVLLMLVPLMPSLPLAVGVLMLRFSISQMDVPTRQALVIASVAEDERAAANGVTAIARSLGSAISPALAGPLYASVALLNVPLYACGALKSAYDLLLYRGFRQNRFGRR